MGVIVVLKDKLIASKWYGFFKVFQRQKHEFRVALEAYFIKFWLDPARPTADLSCKHSDANIQHRMYIGSHLAIIVNESGLEKAETQVNCNFEDIVPLQISIYLSTSLAHGMIWNLNLLIHTSYSKYPWWSSSHTSLPISRACIPLQGRREDWALRFDGLAFVVHAHSQWTNVRASLEHGRPAWMELQHGLGLRWLSPWGVVHPQELYRTSLRMNQGFESPKRWHRGWEAALEFRGDLRHPQSKQELCPMSQDP